MTQQLTDADATELVRELEHAVYNLEIAAYVDGRTHTSLPAGHPDRFASWDRLIESRAAVDSVVQQLRERLSGALTQRAPGR